MKNHKGLLAAAIITIVILLDQALKIWVKTHFYITEDMEITSWFHLLFIENNGMAFGMELGSKLALTIFRIVAVAAIVWYIVRIRRNRMATVGYITCWALIAAGAFGNIIDCMFYGLIFNNPMPPQVATLFPADGGYAPFLMGRVVDMLYFPLFSFDWPAWVPIIGGKHFLFFQPVFNLADAAISCGIIALLIFYSRRFVGFSSSDAGADTSGQAPESVENLNAGGESSGRAPKSQGGPKAGGEPSGRAPKSQGGSNAGGES